MTRQLKDILISIYPGKDIPAITGLLEKHDLVTVLNNIINKVQSEVNLIKPNRENNHIPISLLAGSMLSGINAKISLVKDGKEKKDLELLVSDISHELLLQIFRDFEGDKTMLLSSIIDGLKVSCEINGYDMDALLLVFPLNKIAGIAATFKSNPHNIIYIQRPTYFDWKGLPHALDELSRILKDREVIASVKEFKMLFDVPCENMRVRFNRKFDETVIILFDCLKERKLIEVRGNKGHFMPLRLYGVDFENNLLIQNEPKILKYTIKKNKSKWLQIKGSIDKWLDCLPVK